MRHKFLYEGFGCVINYHKIFTDMVRVSMSIGEARHLMNYDYRTFR